MQKKFTKHLTSIASATALGSMSILVTSALTGCSSNQQEQQVQGNKILTIEQQPNGKYVVVEEVPTSGPNKAILRTYDENGVMHERLMSEDEMKRLAEQEYQKVQQGQSELNQPASSGGEGMGLAGTILAVAAGSLLGNMVGNALMNNKNFASRANSVNRAATHRSARSSSASRKATPRKSFFGSSSRSSSRSYSRFGG